jgi:hypothetical protein
MDNSHPSQVHNAISPVLRLGVCLTVAAWALLAAPLARAELSATDDFQSYSGNPTDTAGGSGDWTTNWRGNSEFDGGTYLSTDSKIDGTQSYGVYGSGGSNGTGVRRAFTSSAGQLRFRWSYRADYDVTSDDGNGSLSRRLAFTLRNGDDADHFTGQRLSFFFAEGNANFAWYDGTDRNTNAVTFSANSVYDCDVTVNTGQRTYTLSVSNRNNAAKFTYSGSWTTGSAGDQLGSVSFLMRGPSGGGNDAFLDSVSVSRVAVPWPGGATAGYASDPASRIHHFEEQPVIGNGYILCMLDLNGSLYDIYFPSVGNRHGVSTANEGYRGPEEFPNCGALDAEANGQMNVINAMGGIGLVVGGTNEIHWLKNQVGTDYTSIGQKWVSDDVNVVLTTNQLNISGNNILVQQYDFVPSTDALPVITDCPADQCRTNYGVYIKRFLLTNLEGTDKTIDFYYDANFNVKGANQDDGMYFETTVNGTNYNAMIVYDNSARTVTGTGCSPNGYGDDGGGNFDATKNYNPTSFGSYDRNASVYFATVMKVVTNTSNGLGLPAEGSWRDHTPTDNQEGWIGRRITIPAGQTNEVDIMIVGSWDDTAAQTGTHNFWGRPMITWFYTNSMATAQTTTENYWSNWVNSGVTVDFPGTYYDRLWKRQLLVAATHQDAVTGAIIAGSHNGAYPFCWPRDGAYAAITFARTGHTNESLNFIHFLRDVAYRDTDANYGDKGFFYQKYTTDGYQVWIAAQVDETASVPWAMFYIYSITGDAGFLTNNWNLAYTSGRASSETTGVSGRSGDLYYDGTYNLMFANNVWEDQNMLTVYGNAAVVRGLYDAANIGAIVGQSSWSTTFSNRAATIRDSGITARVNANVEAADISLLGLTIPYEVFAPTNSLMTNIVEKIHGRQSSLGGTRFDNLVETGGDIAGLVRRYNVKTVSNPGDIDNYWNGGPWFLATSWYGEYFARWQDYVSGKQMISTNLYVLNLLTNKMDGMMIGAEQIAPSGSEKYSSFRLQASWPNLWEADSTMVDQMSMFLDYKPQATNNTCYFAPKLPTGWDRIAFNNMLFKNQRFDIAVAETNVAPQTTTNVVTTVNKKNTGDFNCDIYLRVPVDQITNANHIVVALTNEFAAGTSLNGFTSSVNSNTGAIRVNGPFTTAAQTNTIAVYPDTEKQGVTDFWKAQHGMASTSNSATVLANGLTIKQSYLAGLNPNSAGSKLAISNISVSASGTVTVNWLSQQDGTTVARLYDVYRMQGPFTNGAGWTRISQNVSSAGATTALLEDVSAGTITQRFYRVTVAGHTNDVATPEIVGVHKLNLVTGRNYISMSTLPGTNTLLSVLGTNQLPQGATESAATVVDIWDQTSQLFTNTNRYWLDTGANGWKQSNTATPSNDVLLDPNKGMIITIRSGSPTLRTVGFVPTNSQIQVVQSNGYSVASSTFPRSVTLAASGLQASGFVGGNSKITSDVLYFFNPANQQFDDQIWLDSNGNVWRNEDASAATKQLQPGESFLIRRRNRAANMSWTNAVPYTVPLQGP